jgi:hypothetical protein
MAASHGYLAEVRRQIHRALCPARNLENIAVSSLSFASRCAGAPRIYAFSRRLTSK